MIDRVAQEAVPAPERSGRLETEAPALPPGLSILWAVRKRDLTSQNLQNLSEKEEVCVPSGAYGLGRQLLNPLKRKVATSTPH